MVYRPPKKKTDGPGSSPSRAALDPLGGPLQRAAEGTDVPAGDDRHLVTVDESYAGGDLEDKMWVFWRKQRANIVRLVVAVGVAVVVWQGWNLYQEHAAASMQADYAALDSTSSFLAFAQAHPQTDLGKIAQLEGADGLYKEAKFKEAADAYAQAATLLGADDKAQRARIGQAMALLQAGDTKTGGGLLESLSNDASALESFRAEAAYYLAVLAAQSGDTTGAAKWIERVKEFDVKKGNVWLPQASSLSEVMPLLGDIQIKTGYTPPKPPAAPTSLPSPTAVTPASAPATAPAPISSPPVAAPPAASDAKPAPANGTGLLPMPALPSLK